MVKIWERQIDCSKSAAGFRFLGRFSSKLLPKNYLSEVTWHAGINGKTYGKKHAATMIENMLSCSVNRTGYWCQISSHYSILIKFGKHLDTAFTNNNILANFYLFLLTSAKIYHWQSIYSPSRQFQSKQW